MLAAVMFRDGLISEPISPLRFETRQCCPPTARGRGSGVVEVGSDKRTELYWRSRMESLTLPLDYSAIERILPHRYPFLLVDRITELEPDKRIVGIKNVSLNERLLSQTPGARPALPPTILTECVAQVGAILILSKPENRDKLPFFAGIERVRFRRPVYAGDVVEIEARVKRLRSRMGQLSGYARVNGEVVLAGTMTFALGPAPTAP
jgi:3-hydroxyacyl-[acyl-carrier-protein] dehydratase